MADLIYKHLFLTYRCLNGLQNTSNKDSGHSRKIWILYLKGSISSVLRTCDPELIHMGTTRERQQDS